jgi:acetyltransferase-like isoleucine patch superfamily enzyme
LIDESVFIHPLANVEEGAEIGRGTKVWQFASVRRGARVGADCIIGQGAFVDTDVVIGDKCKLENYGVADDVFLGPGCILTNDLWPRATNGDGSLKTDADWRCEPVTVERRASVGAGAVILPGVKLGENAMVAAGAVVTRHVEPWTVVAGSPARALRTIPEGEREGL